MATVGERVREVRQAKRLTQDQLAEKTRMSKGFISDLENGNRNVSSEYLLRIANVLGASLDFLLRGDVDSMGVTKGPIVIPPELSMAAERMKLSYADTLELLEAHRSVVARRSNKDTKEFEVQDWIKLHEAIKKVFG
jgi:transcriptional regulator with XRE-family HTH domain